MAAAAKTHIAEKGGNPKIVTISAFGGAGPVHAYGCQENREHRGS
jgi:N-methylhydantoinase A